MANVGVRVERFVRLGREGRMLHLHFEPRRGYEKWSLLLASYMELSVSKKLP
jgi:hypothetical protein